jgi:hypothetical protein
MTPRVKNINLTVQGRLLLTELETSAHTENKRMTNHNTRQLSRMDLPILRSFSWTVTSRYPGCNKRDNF